MKVNKNSLLMKMITKSFWFLGTDSDVNLPKTSCGLFVGGVCSGLWHIFYSIFTALFLVGVVQFHLFFLNINFVETTAFVSLPFILMLFISLGVVATTVAYFGVIPLCILANLVVWLSSKETTKNILNKIASLISKMSSGLGRFCKEIQYEEKL